MKYGPLAISFDYGTQSVRAILFDKTGETRCKVKLEFEEPYFSNKPGYAEQNPEFYWEKFIEVSNLCKEKAGDLWDDIVAMSIDTFRDSIIFLDKDNKPLRPMILYLDQRVVNHPEECLPSSMKKLYQLVGMLDMAASQYAATKCNWVAKYEPEIWAKTEKLVMLSTYLHFRLTGELMDASAAQVGHVPFDYKNNTWQGDHTVTSCIFEAKKNRMCQKLFKPCELMARINTEMAKLTGLKEGLPIIASGADKACETLAVGCEGSDVAAISLGTAATIEITTDKYVEPMPYLPAYPSIYYGKYIPEVLIFRGYWMISWFKNQFGQIEIDEAEKQGTIAEKLLDQKMLEIPVGCDGLVLQPYWTAGVHVPDAKGSMIGFSDCHTRMHIYRAIVEGIGFALYNGMKNMEKRAGYKIKRVMISGGGASSRAVCQIMADLLGVSVQKVQTYETSALGAAMASFTGVGEFKNLKEAVTAMSHIKEEYIPNFDNHKLYDAIYENVYNKIYKANKKIFKNIRTIQRRYSK